MVAEKPAILSSFETMVSFIKVFPNLTKRIQISLIHSVECSNGFLIPISAPIKLPHHFNMRVVMAWYSVDSGIWVSGIQIPNVVATCLHF